MNSSLKEDVEFTGLNYKKEIIKIFLLNMVFILVIFAIQYFISQIILTIFASLFLLIFDYLLLTNYGNKKRKILAEREAEFIVVISYFEIFINNNKNVYQSFRMTLPYCSSWMRERIEKFIKEIDEDKTIRPFVNFANNFTTPIVGNVMLSIFQMIDQGKGVDQMTQFTILFDEISKSHQRDLLQKRQNSLDSLNSYPLIGAGVITILVTFCVISLLGEMINVI